VASHELRDDHRDGIAHAARPADERPRDSLRDWRAQARIQKARSTCKQPHGERRTARARAVDHGTMTRGMTYVLLWLALVLLATVLAGWVANDALARDRRWIAWGVVTSFFGLFAVIAWLVARRRSPVRERPGLKVAAPIYAAAFCLVLLEATSGLVFRTFGYQVARVEGQGMASTIVDQDRLVVEKWRYLSSPPRRGDIVMLLYPLRPDRSFVKRVIGQQGDILRSTDGRVFVNDVPLDEPYVAAEYRSDQTWGPVVVPEGYYFVMGDHRNNSSDSRHWGFVPAKYILGRVRLRWYPFSALRTFDN
jgi:signal peptidase I